MEYFYLKDYFNTVCNIHNTDSQIHARQLDQVTPGEIYKRQQELIKYLNALTSDLEPEGNFEVEKFVEFNKQVKCIDHPLSFENHHIAQKALTVYTFEGPVYKVVNTILQNESLQSYPELFPLVNTICCGLVNLDGANK